MEKANGNWLKIDDELMYMDGDSVSTLGPHVPVGIYKTTFQKMRGTFLKITELKLSHGKIYGKSQNIANHIVKAYEMNTEDKNLGVLLSGGRGLGKTLTTRLIINQLKDKYPIITVSEYTPDLPDFLSHLKNCVILMDEFEKFMGGNANGSENEDDQTKQETLLSVLDGNTGCSGNLFLLTVNNLYKVDENFKSRPGRIRYHYRYESEGADTVRKYCEDNLERKELTEEVVKVLGLAKYVSLDIITQFVDELNKFPTLTPLEVMEFFNIESSETKYKINIIAEVDGKQLVYERTFRNFLDEEWCTLSSKFRSKYENVDSIPEHINISLESENIPPYIYGKEKIDVSDISLNDVSGCDNNITIDNVKILSVILEDPDFESFSKRYNKNTI